MGRDGAWIARPGLRVAIAVAATAYYAAALVRSASGGGRAATIGKLVVFAVLIAGGAWAAVGTPAAELFEQLDPFLPNGPTGLVQAMGYTFIALQGFDLIGAVGGEMRDPQRNLPRAMYLSLAIALAVYIPLLLVLMTVGAPTTGTIAEAGASNPEGLVAAAAERFLGPTGYWLVIGAGVLSMLSALQANVLGASRVAFAMARDRTLPRPLGHMRGASGTPALAVGVTAAMLAVLAVAVGDVSAAGAASSLIFLISFAMVHWAAILARRRSGQTGFPFVPIAGAMLCVSLAVFQAFAVPSAGVVVMSWLAIGVAFYFTTLAPGAGLADVSAEARDPDLARLRGRSPLMGAPKLEEANVEARLQDLISRLDADVVLVRAPHLWRVSQVRRVLVPIGGLRDHSRLRARLLASLSRTEACTITFMRTVEPSASPDVRRRAERELRAIARDEAEGQYEVVVEEALDPREAILRRAAETDLVLMGLKRDGRTGHAIGSLALPIAAGTEVPLILAGAKRGRGQRRQAGRARV